LTALKESVASTFKGFVSLPEFGHQVGMATLSSATGLSSTATSGRKSAASMSLHASESEARPNGYQRSLLNTLRGQRQKIRSKSPNDYQHNSLAAGPTPMNLALENYQERFETQLLKVLLQYDLEEEHIGLLPPESAALLQHSLERLCVLLSEVANDNLQCSAGENKPSGTLLIPPTEYLGLEKVLSMAEQSNGPLELATGSAISLFKLVTLDIALRAHFTVKEFSATLSAACGTSSSGRTHTSTAGESRKRESARYARLQTFDRSYRTYLGGILDTMQSDFSNCVGSDVETGTHKIRLRLLDLESLNQPASTLRPDLLVYCPKSGSWQNAVCHIHRLVFRSPSAALRFSPEF
jgi:hypothetical protein